jgi:uncharacterized protein
MKWSPLLAACLLGCGPKTHLPTTTLTIGEVSISVEVADSPEERHNGLMFRDELGADAGMLFVYPDPQPRSFWMENTTIPLSIAYLDDKGTILNIEDMRPLTRDGVRSAGPALYALEVNRGWFESHQVKPGQAVTGLPAPSKE